MKDVAHMAGHTKAKFPGNTEMTQEKQEGAQIFSISSCKNLLYFIELVSRESHLFSAENLLSVAVAELSGCSA